MKQVVHVQLVDEPAPSTHVPPFEQLELLQYSMSENNSEHTLGAFIHFNHTAGIVISH